MLTASNEPERVLIFLLGSLGDTVVALPSLHLIARRFPHAQRFVLTDLMQDPKATPMPTLLAETRLVHGYFQFPNSHSGGSRLKRFLAVAREIRRWQPDMLVYLHEQQGLRRAFRDEWIFRLIGVKRRVGIPTTRLLQSAAFDEASGRFEQRAEYLARALSPLGDARLRDRASWDLNITPNEKRRATELLQPLQDCKGILAFSIGTKIDSNDWEDANWRELIGTLAAKLPDWGLIALGAAVEHERTAGLLSKWHSRHLNLCGSLNIRESAAVLQASKVFMGHDSGPMHLAAAVGCPCVAVFSARNPPGRWFPYGEGHTVFYKKTECAGCGLVRCEIENKRCIKAVGVDEVSAATLSTIA